MLDTEEQEIQNINDFFNPDLYKNTGFDPLIQLLSAYKKKPNQTPLDQMFASSASSGIKDINHNIFNYRAALDDTAEIPKDGIGWTTWAEDHGFKTQIRSYEKGGNDTYFLMNVTLPTINLYDQVNEIEIIKILNALGINKTTFERLKGSVTLTNESLLDALAVFNPPRYSRDDDTLYALPTNISGLDVSYKRNAKSLTFGLKATELPKFIGHTGKSNAPAKTT